MVAVFFCARGAAVLAASILSVTLLVGLYFWVLPRFEQARQKAQDQTRLLEALIYAIPAPIFYKNEDGVYTGCNEHFVQYLG